MFVFIAFWKDLSLLEKKPFRLSHFVFQYVPQDFTRIMDHVRPVHS